MLVRMKTSMAGPAVRRLAGEEVEVEQAEAERLIEKGFADPVKRKREAAVKPKGSKATSSTRAKRTRK